MGKFERSGRASYALWRAVRSWKDSSCLRNARTPANLVSLESADMPCIVHRFRISTGGLISFEEENLPSLGRSCRQHLNGSSVRTTSSLTAAVSTQWRQCARGISSQSSLESDEVDIEAKVSGKDGDLKEDDGEALEEHDESGSELSPEMIAERDSRREALWTRIEKCTDPGKTLAGIQRYISEGHDVVKEDATFIVARFRRFGRFKQAMEISDWIAESKDFPWTEHDQAVRLSLKGKLGLTSEVENLFNNSPPELQVEITYNAVIRHLCEKSLEKKAKEWIERLTKSGCMTRAVPFNRLLLLYKEKHMSQKVPEVLEAMKAANIPKDIFTYNILMSLKNKEKDILGVEKIFEDCLADPNTEVDSATYAGLASAYIDTGFTEKAASALETGETLGFNRSSNVDEVVATLWGKLGNKEKVLKMWETMKEKDNLAVRTYICMIETFGKVGMVDQAESLFKEMVQRRQGTVRPRQFTSLLSVFVQNKMLDKAEALIARLGQLGLKKNATLRHHIVNTYLKLGRLDKAILVVSEAEGKGGSKLWFSTMALLLEGVAKEGNVMAAEKIFDNLATVYNKKTLATFNSLLKAYAVAKVPAEGFLERMVAAKVSPNKDTLALLELCSIKEDSGSVDGNESIPAAVGAPLT